MGRYGKKELRKEHSRKGKTYSRDKGKRGREGGHGLADCKKGVKEKGGHVAVSKILKLE